METHSETPHMLILLRFTQQDTGLSFYYGTLTKCRTLQPIHNFQPTLLCPTAAANIQKK